MRGANKDNASHGARDIKHGIAADRMEIKSLHKLEAYGKPGGKAPTALSIKPPTS